MQSSRSNTDDTNAKTSVQECLIQVASLVNGHAAIFSRLTVKDQVRCQDSSSHDGSTVDELLSEVATLHGLISRLHVSAAEGIMEGLSGLCEDGRNGSNRF